MKVFLSTSFSGHVDTTTGQVIPEYQAFIKEVLAGIRESIDGELFCAVEAEGWQLDVNPAEVGVQQDLDQINDADVLLALIYDKPSIGTQFEIGYAVAKGKRVVLASAMDVPLAYFNQGAVSLGLMTAITYEDTKSLVQNAVLALHAPADEVMA